MLVYALCVDVYMLAVVTFHFSDGEFNDDREKEFAHGAKQVCVCLFPLVIFNCLSYIISPTSFLSYSQTMQTVKYIMIVLCACGAIFSKSYF